MQFATPRLFQKADTFSPLKARSAAVRQPGVFRGDEIIEG
jgi:hypothetical protein